MAINGTFSLSQYTKNLANWQREEDETTYWESQFLQPLQQEYQSTTRAAQTQSAYDITGAYRNFLNYQTQLAQSNLLGTTQKQLSSTARQQYDIDYASALSDYYATTAKAESAYQTGLEKAYGTLEEEAGKLRDINEAIFSHLEDNYSMYGYTEADLDKMFEYTPTGERRLTDLGKNIMANVLESVDQNKKSETFGRNVFFEDLYRTNRKLYDYAMSDTEKLKNVLAGYSSKEYDYSKYTPEVYDYDLNEPKYTTDWAEHKFAEEKPELYAKTQNLKNKLKDNSSVENVITLYKDISTVKDLLHPVYLGSDGYSYRITDKQLSEKELESYLGLSKKEVEDLQHNTGNGLIQLKDGRYISTIGIIWERSKEPKNLKKYYS